MPPSTSVPGCEGPFGVGAKFSNTLGHVAAQSATQYRDIEILTNTFALLQPDVVSARVLHPRLPGCGSSGSERIWDSRAGVLCGPPCSAGIGHEVHQSVAPKVGEQRVGSPDVRGREGSNGECDSQVHHLQQPRDVGRVWCGRCHGPVSLPNLSLIGHTQAARAVHSQLVFKNALQKCPGNRW